MFLYTSSKISSSALTSFWYTAAVTVFFPFRSSALYICLALSTASFLSAVIVPRFSIASLVLSPASLLFSSSVTWSDVFSFVILFWKFKKCLLAFDASSSELIFSLTSLISFSASSLSFAMYLLAGPYSSTSARSSFFSSSTSKAYIIVSLTLFVLVVACEIAFTSTSLRVSFVFPLKRSNPLPFTNFCQYSLLSGANLSMFEAVSISSTDIIVPF